MPKPEEMMRFESEDDELLLGPTTRPDDKMGVGIMGRRPVTNPGRLERFLPVIAQAVRDPDAPQELVNFARILSYHLGRDI